MNQQPALSKEKITLSIERDAFDALAQLTTERKRGEFVSRLILDYRRLGHIHAPQIAAELRGLAEKLESI